MDRTHRNDQSLSRDAAGIGPHARPGVQLVSLGELDGFHVAEGGADVRGWEVRTVSGRELGKVADLLVDAEAHEVVMLDVDLHGSDRHTLAPVRAAQIDRARRVVTLDSADLQDSAVPSLRRGAAPTDEEGRQFHQQYQQAYGARGWDRDRDLHVSRGDHDVEFRRRPHEDAGERDAQLAAATEQDAQRREAERQQRERSASTLAAGQVQTSGSRELRWAQGQEEMVVERRPVIEEVVIRRRVLDPNSPEGRQATQSAQSASGDTPRPAPPIDPTR